MTITKEIKEAISQIDESLYSHIHLKGKYQEKIYEAIKYSLFTGGKRLRPILTLKIFEVFSPDIEKILPFACAVEMIHTYSLIHDDLPCMDDDKMRRGSPTSHMVFGEAIAILAGDGLLNLAYETMIKETMAISEDIDDYKKRLRIMNIISSFSGVEGMIGGQVVDLISTDDDGMDEYKLKFMYEAKTSALIEASVLAGAILGDASEEEIEIIHDFSKKIGLAYQIKDDFLDIEEDTELNKYTFLYLKDNEECQDKLEELSEGALRDLDKLNDRDVRFLKELTTLLLNRKS